MKIFFRPRRLVPGWNKSKPRRRRAGGADNRRGAKSVRIGFVTLMTIGRFQSAIKKDIGIFTIFKVKLSRRFCHWSEDVVQFGDWIIPITANPTRNSARYEIRLIPESDPGFCGDNFLEKGRQTAANIEKALPDLEQRQCRFHADSEQVAVRVMLAHEVSW